MENQRHNDDIIIAKLDSLEAILTLKVSITEKEVALLRDQIAKNNERIRVIEIWQSNSMGRMAVIFTIIGLLLTAGITWLFKHF